MKSFNDHEIQQEEEMIERSMNQGPVAETPKESNNQEPNQPFLNYNASLKLNTFHSADNYNNQDSPARQTFSNNQAKTFIPAIQPQSMQQFMANYLSLSQETPFLITQPLTIKAQRSQTVQNYIEFLNEFYEDF